MNRPRKPERKSDLTLFSGTAQPALAEAIARTLRTPLGKREIERFPDGECRVRIGESVRGRDAYLIQSTGPPVDANLIELFLLADACRRAGARRLTAVVPYLGYARQDRRATGREPVGARLIADLVQAGGFDRVVAVDLHSSAIEGVFSVPLEHLTAVPALAEALRRLSLAGNGVVVAPDLGAARLAERYGKLLEMPVAIVHKTRISGREVAARSVTGDVDGRQPLIVDDMISTGGTIEVAARALASAGALPVAAVVVTHGLLVADAVKRVASVGARRVIVTDTVTPPAELPPSFEVVSIAPILARAVECLNGNRSLWDLAVYG